MKTPREILFERHQTAERRLDLLRQNALATSVHDLRYESSESRSGLWQLLLSLRWHLAGMSAVWLFAAWLSFGHSDGTEQNAIHTSRSPQQLLASLRQSRRQLLELISAPLSDPTPPPPRRSDLELTPLMA
jgi:hypothetical protein